MTGSGVVTVSGTFDWTGGVMAGSGKTTITPSGALLIDGAAVTLGRLLENNGTATWSGGAAGITFAGGTFNNLTGAIFLAAFAAGDASIASSPLAPNVFNNLGIFKKTGAATATILCQLRVPSIISMTATAL